MYEKEFADQVKEKVMKEKFMLAITEDNLILNTKYQKYYYDSKETKEQHKLCMLMQGYEYIEHNQETLYANLFDYNKDVKVYVGEYIKYNAFR